VNRGLQHHQKRSDSLNTLLGNTGGILLDLDPHHL
jgi:hypothetical protein